MGVSMKEAAKSVPWQEMAAKARAMGEAAVDKMEDLAEAAQEKASVWCTCCESSVDKSSEVNLPPVSSMKGSDAA